MKDLTYISKKVIIAGLASVAFTAGGKVIAVVLKDGMDSVKDLNIKDLI